MTDAATVQPDPREATRALTLWQPRPWLRRSGLEAFRGPALARAEILRWPEERDPFGQAPM